MPDHTFSDFVPGLDDALGGKASSGDIAETNEAVAVVESAITKQIQVEIDFGLDENSIARQFVPATWVTADSIIDCNPVALETDDHDMDDIVVEGLIGYATRLQPGVGFNLLVLAPNQSWGRYKCNCQGR